MSRWFRVREVGTGTMDDEYRPEFSDRCDAFSAFPLGTSPVYVMRAYADDATLDGIASEQNATELTTQEALDAYNSSGAGSLSGSGRPVDRTVLESRQRVRSVV